MYTVSSLAYCFSNKHNLREDVKSAKLYNKKKDNKHVHEPGLGMRIILTQINLISPN